MESGRCKVKRNCQLVKESAVIKEAAFEISKEVKRQKPMS